MCNCSGSSHLYPYLSEFKRGPGWEGVKNSLPIPNRSTCSICPRQRTIITSNETHVKVTMANALQNMFQNSRKQCKTNLKANALRNLFLHFMETINGCSALLHCLLDNSLSDTFLSAACVSQEPAKTLQNPSHLKPILKTVRPTQKDSPK